MPAADVSALTWTGRVAAEAPVRVGATTAYWRATRSARLTARCRSPSATVMTST